MTTMFRLACRGSWLKFHPKTGVPMVAAQERTAKGFPTRGEAEEALKTGERLLDAALQALNPSGIPASGRRVAHGTPIHKLMRMKSMLARHRVEEFQTALTLSERMALPSLFAISAADGTFGRISASGCLAFNPDLSQATFFSTATAAKKAMSKSQPRSSDQSLMPTARIVEIGLGLRASLDPRSLAPSFNAATSMMKSLREQSEMSAEIAHAKPKRKRSSASL